MMKCLPHDLTVFGSLASGKFQLHPIEMPADATQCAWKLWITQALGTCVDSACAFALSVAHQAHQQAKSRLTTERGWVGIKIHVHEKRTRNESLSWVAIRHSHCVQALLGQSQLQELLGTVWKVVNKNTKM